MLVTSSWTNGRDANASIAYSLELKRVLCQ